MGFSCCSELLEGTMRSYFVHLDRTTLIWLLINNVFSNNFRRLTFDLCYDYLKDIIIKLILALKLSHSPLYSVEMRASLHAHSGSAFQPLETTHTLPLGAGPPISRDTCSS